MLVAPKFTGKFQDCLFDFESDGLLHEEGGYVSSQAC